jgi:hypothetical protein
MVLHSSGNFVQKMEAFGEYEVLYTKSSHLASSNLKISIVKMRAAAGFPSAARSIIIL